MWFSYLWHPKALPLHLPLPVLGEKFFVLLIVSLGNYNSVVKHLYFSILPLHLSMFTVQFFSIHFLSKLLPSMAYVDAQKGQSHRDLIFEMKQFKQNGPQTPPLWVVLNNLWVQEWKIKPPREQEITLSKKTKTTKSPARAKHFYRGYLGDKNSSHFTLCLQGTSASKQKCGRRWPDFDNSFFSSIWCFYLFCWFVCFGFFLFGFGFLFVFYLFPVTQEGKNEAQKLEIWSLWQIWYWSGTLLF